MLFRWRMEAKVRACRMWCSGDQSSPVFDSVPLSAGESGRVYRWHIAKQQRHWATTTTKHVYAQTDTAVMPMLAHVFIHILSFHVDNIIILNRHHCLCTHVNKHVVNSVADGLI